LACLAAGGLGLLPLVAATTTPVGAASVASLRQRASQLASQIEAEGTRINILSEEYDQAQIRVGELGQQVAAETAALGAAQAQVDQQTAALRQQAILAYVTSDSGGASAFLDGSQDDVPLAQGYLEAASGTLAEATNAVQLSERTLANRRGDLEATQHAARLAAAQIAADASAARQVSGELEATLSQVKGQLATAVAAQEAAQAAAAAAAARAAAAAAAAAQPPPPPPPPVVTPPVVTPPAGGGGGGGGAGEAAVQAAESQLGVPYVWGGATPGVGFDCSGLTMWAWSQAGVSLAHGATDQYYEIQHIPMPYNDPTEYLEPGDLIFFGGSGYLYHVVMYVGNGEVIQAEETGTDIMITPIPPGWYGAGRP
jgi:peptidoglycan DL-endopeptidase CwlO